jgi:hypothetical protein
MTKEILCKEDMILSNDISQVRLKINNSIYRLHQINNTY